MNSDNLFSASTIRPVILSPGSPRGTLLADVHGNWLETVVQRWNTTTDTTGVLNHRKTVQVEQEKLAAAISNGPATASRYLLKRLQAAPTETDAVPSIDYNALFTIGTSDTQEESVLAERSLYESTREALTPKAAACASVWAFCHAAWLHRCDNSSEAHAFTNSLWETPDAVAHSTRALRFCRLIGGHPGVDGPTTTMLDCPAATGWWRALIATQAAAWSGHTESPMQAEPLHGALLAPGVWAALVKGCLTSATVLCAPSAVSAAVCGVAALEVPSATAVTEALQALARLSLQQSLHLTSFDVLVDAVEAGIANSQ